MEFSSGFLSKLLDSAVTYYNADNDVYELPNKHQNVESAIDYFSEALIFEAHKSMQNEIVSNDLPILHAINLDSKDPGIISGQTDNKDKFKVHKKKSSKPKKEKTKEQLEKAMEIAEKKAKEKEEKKKEKEELKAKEKEEKLTLKKNKSTFKELKKKKSKLGKKAEKLSKDANKANKRLASKKNPSQELKEEVESINKEANEVMNEYNNLNQEFNELGEEVEAKEAEISKKKEEKETKKKELAEKRKKAREEKKLKAQQKKEEKEKKIADQIDENDMNIYDELFDLAMEANNMTENLEGECNNSEISLDKVKLYESPLPYQRHINALELSQPNPQLIPALLEGKSVDGDGFIKIFHGPPGTGKTYRLMKELSELINNKKHSKILVCAPSNVATINMYRRAKSWGIEGSLVISDNKIPEDLAEELETDIENHKVIFSTISMRFGYKLKKIKFSTIMMDEAAQCQEAWVWGLLRPELKYIYMAGDHHQLPALVSDDGVSLNHGISMMQRLISIGYTSELLDTQRRMHPNIVAFSNTKYYNGKLKTEYDSVYNLKPIEILNISGQEKRIGTSYANDLEAQKVVELYNEFKEIFDDVIIISPYQAQIIALKQIDSNLEIHTVDSFQGREAEAVILTTVRTKNLGFWSDYRRLNVAMTRAKHVLRIIGNVKAWQNSKGPLKDLWNFSLIKESNEIV